MSSEPLADLSARRIRRRSAGGDSPLTRFASVMGAAAATGLLCATYWPAGPVLWPALAAVATGLLTAVLAGKFDPLP
jgi:hypothetical protein